MQTQIGGNLQTDRPGALSVRLQEALRLAPQGDQSTDLDLARIGCFARTAVVRKRFARTQIKPS